MFLHSLKSHKDKHLVDFLKKNFSKIKETQLVRNYHPDFENESSNFFNILQNGRYENGNYFILEEDGKFCGSAGWNPYRYRNEIIALGLTRCYLSREYRNKWLLSKYFLPMILEETKEFKKLWLSVNEYNKTIYKGFELFAQGKPVGLGEPWPKIFSQFIPIGKKTIYFTKQYVLEWNKNGFE